MLSAFAARSTLVTFAMKSSSATGSRCQHRLADGAKHKSVLGAKFRRGAALEKGIECYSRADGGPHFDWISALLHTGQPYHDQEAQLERQTHTDTVLRKALCNVAHIKLAFPSRVFRRRNCLPAIPPRFTPREKFNLKLKFHTVQVPGLLAQFDAWASCTTEPLACIPLSFPVFHFTLCRLQPISFVQDDSKRYDR